MRIRELGHVEIKVMNWRFKILKTPTGNHAPMKLFHGVHTE